MLQDRSVVCGQWSVICGLWKYDKPQLCTAMVPQHTPGRSHVTRMGNRRRTLQRTLAVGSPPRDSRGGDSSFGAASQPPPPPPMRRTRLTSSILGAPRQVDQYFDGNLARQALWAIIAFGSGGYSPHITPCRARGLIYTRELDLSIALRHPSRWAASGPTPHAWLHGLMLVTEPVTLDS